MLPPVAAETGAPIAVDDDGAQSPFAALVALLAPIAPIAPTAPPTPPDLPACAPVDGDASFLLPDRGELGPSQNPGEMPTAMIVPERTPLWELSVPINGTAPTTVEMRPSLAGTPITGPVAAGESPRTTSADTFAPTQVDAPLAKPAAAASPVFLHAAVNNNRVEPGPSKQTIVHIDPIEGAPRPFDAVPAKTARSIPSVMVSIAASVHAAMARPVASVAPAPMPSRADAGNRSSSARPVASLSMTNIARPAVAAIPAIQPSTGVVAFNDATKDTATDASPHVEASTPHRETPVANAAASPSVPHAEPAAPAVTQTAAINSTTAPIVPATTSPTIDANEPALRLPLHAAAAQEAAPEIQALALRIASKSAQGARRFDIRLDPPELGRIDVRLDVSDGRAQAQLSADKPQTLELLQRDHRSLERALRDAGLDLGGMSFSLKGEDRRSAPNETPHDRRREERVAAVNAASAAATPITRWSHVADARVDIRV